MSQQGLRRCRVSLAACTCGDLQSAEPFELLGAVRPDRVTSAAGAVVVLATPPSVRGAHLAPLLAWLGRTPHRRRLKHETDGASFGRVCRDAHHRMSWRSTVSKR